MKCANSVPNSIDPIPARGPIQLQTHGSKIRWRNIKVREVPAEEANAILAKHGAEGFSTIFSGQDLTGWAGPIDQYQVKDGVLMCKPEEGGTIYYNKEVTDFAARLEFRLPPGGNNGLAIRYPVVLDLGHVGAVEAQSPEMANVVLRALCGGRGQGSGGRAIVLAVESERRAEERTGGTRHH